MEQLLDEELNFDEAPVADFLNVLISSDNFNKFKKNQAFLYKPVLVSPLTIFCRTETTVVESILPSLRLLSSDLVIDEVDDFDGKDLIAIGRLIHLAGMLGRKVMISSATIALAVAEGLNAYQKGWRLHAIFKNISSQVVCAWVDEFTAQVNLLEKIDSPNVCQQYRSIHQQFIDKRSDTFSAANYCDSKA